MNKDDEELLELCRSAIKAQSYSGHEKDMAELIKSAMEKNGFDKVETDKFGSVIGTISGKRKGKTILMDGHMDTVDVVDRDEWKHDPFGAEIVGGKLYGRGASDMKSSLCTMVMAAARFAKETNRDFAGKICVSGTVHEECFEGVSSREVSRIVQPDFVIIGEATSGTVKIGQRGRAEVIVETEGVSCHSSNPEKGINAVYLMNVLIDEIRKIKPNEHKILGKGILELTDIKSFPYPGASVVPRVCRATFDRRTLVGEDEKVILGQVEEAIERAKKREPNMKAKVYLAEGEEKCWTGETIRAKRFFPAWCYDEKDEIIAKAISALDEAGLPHKVSHFSFCTNGSHFCGERGTLGIGYGPSEEWLAHVRDEYIEVDLLPKACEGFKCILRALTR